MSVTPFDRENGKINLPTVLEIERVYNELNSQRKTAKHLGITEYRVRTALDIAKVLEEAREGERVGGVDTFSLHNEPKQPDPKPLYTGAVGARRRKINPLPSKGKVKRYLLTCAQNNTPVNKPVWENIEALSEHYNANILVSCFTYNHNAFGELSVKPGTNVHQTGLWYDEEILPYVSDEAIQLAPSLVWCGELNIMPTAIRPLSGLNQYTGKASAIIPHVKFALESIATPLNEDTKFNYTTGTVTQRNYIHRKAGLKADFHHAYGCLIAEVLDDGTWFVRQINADDSGTLYDLDVKVENGKVTTGNAVTAISWGDVHVDQISPVVKMLAWESGGMLDTLRPEHQFFHDVFDNKTRSHHGRDDIFMNVNKIATGRDLVEEEVQRCADFLTMASRDWCQSVVVDSNHDIALTRYIKEVDSRRDPTNALFHSKCYNKLLNIYHADEQREFHLLEWVMREAGLSEDVKFLRADEPYRVFDIECGYHGHKGTGGSRGSINGYAKLSMKVIIGHSHSAGIKDGAYQNGCSTKYNMGYNSGAPSSWSHSHTVITPNGKRAIVTMKNGKWRA